jgi:hypothetical protein
VPVQADGTFSTTMSSSVPYGTCILRAVPSGLPAGSNLRSYTGPRVTTEYKQTDKISGGPNNGKAYDYYVLYQGAHAMNDYVSTTHGGLWDSRLEYSDGTSSNYLWYENAALTRSEDSTRSYLKVDGKNAYGPYAARYLFSGSADNAGFPVLAFSATRNATTGNTTIRETDPIVVCPGTAFPPTAVSCPHFNSAGVRLERTIVTNDGGRQVHITDVWRSTNGKAHTISAHYAQFLQARDSAPPGSDTQVGLKMPWLGGYKTFTSDKLFAGPSRVPNTVFVRDDNTAPDGNQDFPRGAISFDVVPQKVHWAANDEFRLNDEGIKVPAGGKRIVRQDFVMGATESEVATKAAANARRINPYRPDALVKKPGGRYVGNNIYNATGYRQAMTVRTARTARAQFVVTVQNDGTATDGFKIKGPGAGLGFRVTYFAGATGTTNITSAVQNGTYRLTNLAPGTARVLRLVVKVRAGTDIGTVRAWLLTATSLHDGTRKDAVKAVVKVVSG